MDSNTKLKIWQRLNQTADVKYADIQFDDYNIKCSNCDQLFTMELFEKHVCDYDEHKNFINDLDDDEIKPTILSKAEDPSTSSIPNEIDDNKLVLLSKVKVEINENSYNENNCLELLKENSVRLKKFIKEELKIELNDNINYPSSPIPSTGSVIKTTVPDKLKKKNSKSVDKAKGSHGCSICERKFVHASGLSRHMDKHENDIIPIKSKIRQPTQSLQVINKCLICNMIFVNSKLATDHLLDVHSRTYGTQIVEHDLSDEDNDNKFNSDISIVKKDNNEIAWKNYSNNQIPNSSNDQHGINTNELNSLNIQQTNLEDTNHEYIKSMVINSVLQCEYCDILFTDVTSLLMHSALHDPTDCYQCTLCDINVSNVRDILLHSETECLMLKKNDDKINLQKYFVCNVCETKFVSLDDLYEHRYTMFHFFPRLNVIIKKLQINCEYCGLLFDNVETIIAHHQERHKKKSKKEETSMTTDKFRQYLCDVCGKSYTQSSHLWQHLRFHRGVKPFACKEPNCGRRFTIRPDLNDHIRKCHTGERPYHCLICGKRFLTGSVFYQHRLIHRGERRYGCEECGKRFYRADALKNHQRIHTGEKPYACTICPKSFRQRGDRDKHIRARHGRLAATQITTGDADNDSGNNIKKRKYTSKFGSKRAGINNDIVYVGNVAFPTSMFKPIIKDIDDDGNNECIV